MSLIDDALKRAQAADEAAARERNRPWIPTPMPDPAIARRRALVRWLGILGAAAVIAGAGTLLVIRLSPGGEPRLGRPGERPAAEALAAPAATPTPDFVAAATPIVVAPPPGAVPPRSASGASAAPARRPHPTLAAEAAPAEASVPAPPAPRPPREQPGGRTWAGVASLPGGERIELGGIVWSETEPRALVNDRILGVGGYVEGWSIQKIEEDRVVLEKDGATLTITVR